MKPLTSIIRWARKLGSSSLLFAAMLALGTTPAFSSSPSPEKIQATYTKDGNVVRVTLTVYNYSTSADLQALSLAFQRGHDRELATELSKTKAAGLCTITGDLSFDVAFIQMVVTPTGRQITFIANRPLQPDEVNPSSDSQSFDLLVGQLDLNDTDNTKSTGFLYRASRLVIDEQGEFHYDLAGNPWSMVNVLDSNWTPVLAGHEAPTAPDQPLLSSLP
ncbi:MAG TPA: hypothetical protein VJX73_01400 [Terracidiphilus sp.]|nr:hypothetical protein [Terracidiphilus sp.]